MVNITLAAEEDVFDLLDVNYVEQNLPNLESKILFSCVDSDSWQDDSWVHTDGTQFHIIKLPYLEVKAMPKEKVRELMLQKAWERLRQVA